ncbi:uncharacterized protein TNCV_1948391 [Trichonephila clavipes]|nr:uncharacterized protein TNCV_1948391 [Trichonephila clavipes]
MDAYKKATAEKYQFLLVDCFPTTDEEQRLRQSVFPDQKAGNVPKANVKRLCRYKRTIRQLDDRSISLGRKRKLLTTNQTGGFLPLVLPAVLSFVGGLLGKTIGKRI